MSCGFAKLKPKSTPKLTSWSAYQSTALKAASKRTNSKIMRAAEILDGHKKCPIRLNSSDAVDYFENYLIAQHPAEYREWMTLTPAKIAAAILKNPTLYLAKVIVPSSGEAVPVYKGSSNFPSPSAIKRLSARRKSSTRKTSRVSAKKPARKSVSTRKSAARKSRK
jgi:hypothetical protein